MGLAVVVCITSRPNYSAGRTSLELKKLEIAIIHGWRKKAHPGGGGGRSEPR